MLFRMLESGRTLLALSAFSLFAAIPVEPSFVIDAPDEGGWFGWSMASLDLDGDGIDELAIGAPLLRVEGGSSYQGGIYVYRGGHLDEPPIHTVRGYTDSEQLGIAMDNVGDATGNGHDDLVVGANVTSSIGRAYLLEGGTTFDGSYHIYTEGERHVDNYGYSVTGVGDIDGDGYPDWAVGALYNDERGSRTGKVYLYRGGEPLDTTPYLFFVGRDSLDDFGTHLDGGMDFQGDGWPDLLVGAVQAGSYWINPGEAVLFYGGPDMDSTLDVFTQGEDPMDFYGGAVSFLGDIDADGYADFAAGSYNNSSAGEDAGRAYFFMGRPDHDGTPDFTISGNPDDNIAGAISDLGDVDGDGYDDFAISSDHPPSHPDSGMGAILIYRGGETVDTIPDFYTEGELPSDAYGWEVTRLGDVTGDHIPDFAVSATRWNNRGRVYVYKGWQPPSREFITEIRVETEGLSPEYLAIGQDEDATAGYDPGLDIIRLPTPPARTDAGLTSDTYPYIEYLKRDFRNTEASHIQWSIDLNSEGNTQIGWRGLGLPEGVFLLEDVVDMKSHMDTEVNGPRAMDIDFTWQIPSEFSVGMEAGWNLVGIPGYPMEYNTETLLGEYAFFFDPVANSYIRPERIPTGQGFFSYSFGSSSHIVPLIAAEYFSRVIQPGWNIMAAPLGGTPVTDIGTSPEGGIVSIYGFNPITGAYEEPDYLLQGKGYFFLASVTCTLTIGDRPGALLRTMPEESTHFGTRTERYEIGDIVLPVGTVLER